MNQAITTKTQFIEKTNPNESISILKNKIYTRLLDRLNLSEPHLQDLIRRGFNFDTIENRDYKSYSLWDSYLIIAEFSQEFSKDILKFIPGFSITYESFPSESKHIAGFNCPQGLLIPVRDYKSRIIV